MGLPDRLLQFVHEPNTVDLDEALLWLAACRPGGADVTGALAALDHHASALAGDDGEAVCHLVYEVLGYAGDDADYHQADNSYLDRVVTRRRGMPITLAAVVLGVARRADIAFEAIGLPGHFLLRDVGANVLRDPFDEGRRWTVSDAAERVAAMGLEMRPAFLAPIDDLSFLLRVVNNLTHTFATRSAADLDWLLDVRLALPLERQDRRLLASLCEQRGRYLQAAELLESLPDAATEERRAAALRARLN